MSAFGGNQGTGGGGPHITGYRDFVVIGRGASSVVYRAFEESIARTVAIKVLSVTNLNAKALKQFDHEREIMGSLGKYPNIVQILSSGTTPSNQPYLVMEYFEEGSVADHLESVGTFSVADTVDIGTQIAAAVARAHANDVFHRDIKPQNILLGSAGPALADFGISRLVTNLEWTQSLEALTPLHAPPESFDAAIPTVQGDIYSLGSTLYTMLARNAPFAGAASEGPAAFRVHVQRDEVPRIPRADVPTAIFDVLRKAMAKRPEDRYVSAEEFRSAFAAAAEGRASGVSTGDLEETINPFGLRSQPDDQVIDVRLSGLDDQPVGVVEREPEGNDPIEAGFTQAPDWVKRVPEPETQSEVVRSRRGPFVIGAAAVVLVLIGIVLAAALLSGRGPSHTQVTQSSFTTTDAPTNLTATPNSSGTTVNLQWTDNTGGEGRYIVWTTAPGVETRTSAVTQGSTTATLTSLNPAVPYCFVVNAVLPSTAQYAPSCACIRGGKLTTVPHGFPSHLTCS